MKIQTDTKINDIEYNTIQNKKSSHFLNSEKTY